MFNTKNAEIRYLSSNIRDELDLHLSWLEKTEANLVDELRSKKELLIGDYLQESLDEKERVQMLDSAMDLLTEFTVNLKNLHYNTHFVTLYNYFEIKLVTASEMTQTILKPAKGYLDYKGKPFSQIKAFFKEMVNIDFEYYQCWDEIYKNKILRNYMVHQNERCPYYRKAIKNRYVRMVKHVQTHFPYTNLDVVWQSDFCVIENLNFLLAYKESICAFFDKLVLDVLFRAENADKKTELDSNHKTGIFG